MTKDEIKKRLEVLGKSKGEVYGLVEIIVKNQGKNVTENLILENKEFYLVVGRELPKYINLGAKNKLLNSNYLKIQIDRGLSNFFKGKLSLKEVIRKNYGYEYISELKSSGRLLMDGKKVKMTLNYDYHVRVYVVNYNLNGEVEFI